MKPYKVIIILYNLKKKKWAVLVFLVFESVHETQQEATQ